MDVENTIHHRSNEAIRVVFINPYSLPNILSHEKSLKNDIKPSQILRNFDEATPKRLGSIREQFEVNKSEAFDL